MAHFARVNSDNQVIYVTPVNNANLLNENAEEIESLGVEYLLKTLPSDTIETWQETDTWVKTSYNGSFRGKYAALGDTWREDLDAFIGQKPYPSWILNTKNGKWQSPIKNAFTESDSELYYWDEDAYQADNTMGWVLIDS